ncbi:MAG TPA: Smr/MutS family protein [Thermoanaerobaculia bacterium]|nr:Smr/MutS family protein [Thermoanaerobaculia bacterium]
MKRVPIEDSLDLHSFLPRDVPSVVSEYLDEALRRGYREVRLVHGKGRGVRRAEVRRLLEADPRVADAFDAPPERGGFGATVVVLKD